MLHYKREPMGFIISKRVREKLMRPDHGVTEAELLECFANRCGGECTDEREEHKTNPLTRWFVAETDYGRRIKVMYVPLELGIEIKSAYPSTDEVKRIFEKFKK